MSEINTNNRFVVGGNGDTVLIVIPPRGPMTKEDALLLAAYLVAIADDGTTEHSFSEVLEAVQNT